MPSRSGSEPSPAPIDPDLGAAVERNVRSRPGNRSRQAARRSPAAVLCALGSGGALGAVARYAISLAIPAGPTQFPWGTFAVNVSGSLALGFLLVVLMERIPRGRLARLALGSGFIGAYTTFSTYVVEAVQLVRHGHPGLAAAYLLASTMAGIGAAWLGMTAARFAMLGVPQRSEERAR